MPPAKRHEQDFARLQQHIIESRLGQAWVSRWIQIRILQIGDLAENMLRIIEPTDLGCGGDRQAFPPDDLRDEVVGQIVVQRSHRAGGADPRHAVGQRGIARQERVEKPHIGDHRGKRLLICRRIIGRQIGVIAGVRSGDAVDEGVERRGAAMAILVALEPRIFTAPALIFNRSRSDQRLEIGRGPAGQRRPVVHRASQDDGPGRGIIVLQKLVGAHAAAPLDRAAVRRKRALALERFEQPFALVERALDLDGIGFVQRYRRNRGRDTPLLRRGDRHMRRGGAIKGAQFQLCAVIGHQFFTGHILAAIIMFLPTVGGGCWRIALRLQMKRIARSTPRVEARGGGRVSIKRRKGGRERLDRRALQREQEAEGLHRLEAHGRAGAGKTPVHGEGEGRPVGLDDAGQRRDRILRPIG
ncbi:hypothetical protein D9M73_121520 [compost metagenome]